MPGLLPLLPAHYVDIWSCPVRGLQAARTRARSSLPTLDILLQAADRSAATRRRQLPTACGEIPVRRTNSRSLSRDSWRLCRTARILASIAASDRFRFARPARAAKFLQLTLVLFHLTAAHIQFNPGRRKQPA
jgi:hypothetical protein